MDAAPPQHFAYSDRPEAYLRYARGTARQQRRYARALETAPLPLGDYALLQQLTGLLAFCEDLTEAGLARVVHDEDEDDEEAGPVSYARLIEEAMAKLGVETGVGGATEAPVETAPVLQVALRWHDAVCARRQPMTGLYARCLMLSWTAFCKLFYLVVYEDTALYRLMQQRRAADYEYCARVQLAENVVISAASVARYTVNELWNSLQLCVPSLYKHAFTSHQKTYLYALFFRYCELLCAQQTPAELTRVLDNPLFVRFGRAPAHNDDNSDDEEEEDSDDSDSSSSSDDESSDSAEEEEYEAYQQLLVPLDARCSLRAAYLIEGQLAFLGQLKRVSFSETLAAHALAAPLRVTVEAEAAECETRWRECVGEVALHGDLKRFVREAFKSQLVALYVYHGEMERYRMRWPQANCQPCDVLALLRPSDNLAAGRVLELAPAQLLAEPALYERELVLLTKCATLQWLSYRGEAQAAKIDAAFLLEELAPLDTIDSHIAALLEGGGRGQMPLLLRLVRVYYVAAGDGRLYRTERFVEAYLLWLQLLVQGRHFAMRNAPPRLKSCLQHFIVT